MSKPNRRTKPRPKNVVYPIVEPVNVRIEGDAAEWVRQVANGTSLSQAQVVGVAMRAGIRHLGSPVDIAETLNGTSFSQSPSKEHTKSQN